ncbi:ABC transporter permease [Actinoalloteichus sp. AHMU CJ021]|uniref:Peptide/nickel transport system permease protein n=1 Tax=Actinoalloteichus caeruleus DSM 43889 TaxID=1120930 RepID=A0ABT1JE25_ACTCY|nr:ABC transporter permease [Actinoalloteichus caeruleus]AUS81124.1 ABC transporter permease [Actinoalloteichus sp. AHMU CJ021]MCP2330663.1 peptide/nickel transport system permease protein [Actinoalloteichus caeruleus DSM 43889]
MTTDVHAGTPTSGAGAGRSQRRRALRRLRRNPAGMVGLVLVVLLVLAAALAPLLAPADPAAVDFDRLREQPSAAAWLGTDEFGRDQLSRVLFGLRSSLFVGVLAVLLAVVVAVPLGLAAGYYRRFVDPVVSRLTDTMLAFPFLVLAVGLAAILGPSLLNAAIAIGVSQVPNIIRVMRGETLRLANENYIDAAVAGGAHDGVILFRHILPNSVNALLIQVTVGIPAAILGEAVLSFLGLGVQPPTPSLGVMLSSAQPFFAQAPWLALFPGLVIVAATLAFNLLGDGLRDALDPKGHRR